MEDDFNFFIKGRQQRFFNGRRLIFFGKRLFNLFVELKIFNLFYFLKVMIMHNEKGLSFRMRKGRLNDLKG